MTSSVSERFRLIRQDVALYGSVDDFEGFFAEFVFEQWAHKIPMIGAMTTRNFEEIRELLQGGTRLEATAADHARVVARGLAKTAPFHRSRNSVADALLIEMYASALASADPGDHYAFITSNSDDFSTQNGDKRQPHEDLAALFASETSTYRLGDAGLEQALYDEFGEEMAQLVQETYFVQEPRGLSDILAAEKELFDKIWYERSMRHDRELSANGKTDELAEHRRIAREARERVEKTYGTANLGPFDPFDLGMLNGKLSALRWVLGSEWDFLDT